MRKIRVILLLLICFTLLIPTALAADETGVRAAWSATASGGLTCELTFTCTIPTPKESVKISLPEGAERISVVNYAYSKSGNTVTIRSGSYFSGQQSFRVNFSLPSALTRDEEGVQTISLPLVPADFGMDVEYVEYSLKLPKNYDNEPVITLDGEPVAEPGYTLELDSLSGGMFVSVPNGSALTLTLDLGKGFFVAQTNHLSRIFSSWRLLLVLLLAAAIVYWYFGFFRGARRPRSVRRAMAPDGTTAAELPCLFYGGDADICALIFEWASLGYIHLDQDAKGRWYASPRISVGPERRDAERTVYRGFFSSGPLRLSGERWNRLAAAAGRKLRSGWPRKIFDPRSGSPRLLQLLCLLYGALCLLSGAASLNLFAAIISVPAGIALCWLLQQGALSYLRRGNRKLFYLGLAAAGVMLLLLILLSDPLMFLAILIQILCAFAVWTGGRRTDAGADGLDQLLGFRKYLLNMKPNQAQSSQRRDPQVFYRLLPYACALNCENALADVFRDLNPEPCDWMDADGSFDSFWNAFQTLLSGMRGQ